MALIVKQAATLIAMELGAIAIKGLAKYLSKRIKTWAI